MQPYTPALYAIDTCVQANTSMHVSKRIIYVCAAPRHAGNTSTTSCFMLTYIRIVIISQLFSVVVASQRRQLGLGLGLGQGQGQSTKRVGRPSLGLTLKSL